MKKLLMLIATHRAMARIRGFTPTDLMFFIDNPAPIKKRVSTKPFLQTRKLFQIAMSEDW